MYKSKHFRGFMSVGDFIRLPAGAQIIYIVNEDSDYRAAQKQIQSYISRVGAIIKQRKVAIVDMQDGYSDLGIEVTLIKSAD